MKSISIVIPSYNGAILLNQNLPFVYNALKTSGITNYEIIVSDDNSTDETESVLTTKFPEVLLVLNKNNRGFASNINNGLKQATKDLVLFLNSDVTLTDGYFKNLLSYFEKPDTFAVGCKIIGTKENEIQDGAKVIKNYAYGNLANTKNLINKKEKSLYSVYVHGASLLACRKKVVELNGFNELYNPYYFEDVDLSYRAWRIGYKCYFEENAVCIHPSSSTINKEVPKKVKMIMKRNKMFLNFIHLQGYELWYYLTTLSFKILFQTIAFNSYYREAYLLFIKDFRMAIKSKARIKVLQKQKKNNSSMRNVVEFINKNTPDSENTYF